MHNHSNSDRTHTPTNHNKQKQMAYSIRQNKLIPAFTTPEVIIDLQNRILADSLFYGN